MRSSGARQVEGGGVSDPARKDDRPRREVAARRSSAHEEGKDDDGWTGARRSREGSAEIMKGPRGSNNMEVDWSTRHSRVNLKALS